MAHSSDAIPNRGYNPQKGGRKSKGRRSAASKFEKPQIKNDGAKRKGKLMESVVGEKDVVASEPKRDKKTPEQRMRENLSERALKRGQGKKVRIGEHATRIIKVNEQITTQIDLTSVKPTVKFPSRELREGMYVPKKTLPLPRLPCNVRPSNYFGLVKALGIPHIRDEARSPKFLVDSYKPYHPVMGSVRHICNQALVWHAANTIVKKQLHAVTLLQPCADLKFFLENLNSALETFEYDVKVAVMVFAPLNAKWGLNKTYTHICARYVSILKSAHGLVVDWGYGQCIEWDQNTLPRHWLQMVPVVGLKDIEAVGTVQFKGEGAPEAYYSKDAGSALAYWRFDDGAEHSTLPLGEFLHDRDKSKYIVHVLARLGQVSFKLTEGTIWNYYKLKARCYMMIDGQATGPRPAELAAMSMLPGPADKQPPGEQVYINHKGVEIPESAVTNKTPPLKDPTKTKSHSIVKRVVEVHPDTVVDYPPSKKALTAAETIEFLNRARGGLPAYYTATDDLDRGFNQASSISKLAELFGLLKRDMRDPENKRNAAIVLGQLAGEYPGFEDWNDFIEVRFAAYFAGGRINLLKDIRAKENAALSENAGSEQVSAELFPGRSWGDVNEEGGESCEAEPTNDRFEGNMRDSPSVVAPASSLTRSITTVLAAIPHGDKPEPSFVANEDEDQSPSDREREKEEESEQGEGEGRAYPDEPAEFYLLLLRHSAGLFYTTRDSGGNPTQLIFPRVSGGLETCLAQLRTMGIEAGRWRLINATDEIVFTERGKHRRILYAYLGTEPLLDRVVSRSFGRFVREEEYRGLHVPGYLEKFHRKAMYLAGKFKEGVDEGPAPPSSETPDEGERAAVSAFLELQRGRYLNTESETGGEAEDDRSNLEDPSRQCLFPETVPRNGEDGLAGVAQAAQGHAFHLAQVAQMYLIWALRKRLGWPVAFALSASFAGSLLRRLATPPYDYQLPSAPLQQNPWYNKLATKVLTFLSAKRDEVENLPVVGTICSGLLTCIVAPVATFFDVWNHGHRVSHRRDSMGPGFRDQQSERAEVMWSQTLERMRSNARPHWTDLLCGPVEPYPQYPPGSEASALVNLVVRGGREQDRATILAGISRSKPGCDADTIDEAIRQGRVLGAAVAKPLIDTSSLVCAGAMAAAAAIGALALASGVRPSFAWSPNWFRGLWTKENNMAFAGYKYDIEQNTLLYGPIAPTRVVINQLETFAWDKPPSDYLEFFRRVRFIIESGNTTALHICFGAPIFEEAAKMLLTNALGRFIGDFPAHLVASWVNGWLDCRTNSNSPTVQTLLHLLIAFGVRHSYLHRVFRHSLWNTSMLVGFMESLTSFTSSSATTQISRLPKAQQARVLEIIANNSVFRDCFCSSYPLMFFLAAACVYVFSKTSAPRKFRYAMQEYIASVGDTSVFLVPHCQEVGSHSAAPWNSVEGPKQPCLLQEGKAAAFRHLLVFAPKLTHDWVPMNSCCTCSTSTTNAMIHRLAGHRKRLTGLRQVDWQDSINKFSLHNLKTLRRIRGLGLWPPPGYDYGELLPEKEGWLARFPLGYRIAAMKEYMSTDYNLQSNSSKYQVMCKFEKNFDFESAHSRSISIPSFADRVHCGPYTWAASKELSKCLLRNESSLIFACGMTVDEIGQHFGLDRTVLVAVQGDDITIVVKNKHGSKSIELDVSRMDMHHTIGSLNFSLDLLQTHPLAPVDKYRIENELKKYKSRPKRWHEDRVTATVRYALPSGRNDTTLTNSSYTLAIILEHFGSYNPNYDGTAEDLERELVNNFADGGFVMKSKVCDFGVGTVFLQRRFFRVNEVDYRVPGPRPGRILLRLFVTDQAQSYHKDRSTILDMARCVLAAANFVPIVNDLAIRLVDTVTDASVGNRIRSFICAAQNYQEHRNNFTEHADSVFEMSVEYGVAIEDLEHLRSQIRGGSLDSQNRFLLDARALHCLEVLIHRDCL